MRLPEEPDIDEGINILPMIDVIFSILAFLIISTLFLSHQDSLPVNLPSASTSERVSEESINITIKADGDLFLNNEFIELSQLKTALSKLTVAKEENLVIIKADETVNHGRVVEVMDYLRQVEGVSLAIAAKKPVD